MPKLRITVPAEGGPTYERELWVVRDDENGAALTLGHLANPEAPGLFSRPTLLCYGTSEQVKACFEVLQREFTKNDPIAHRLLGLPLVDMEQRDALHFIPPAFCESYLGALRKFETLSQQARDDLWERHLIRMMLAAPHNLSRCAINIITPRRTALVPDAALT